jgi:hypothetical protein
MLRITFAYFPAIATAGTASSHRPPPHFLITSLHTPNIHTTHTAAATGFTHLSHVLF